MVSPIRILVAASVFSISCSTEGSSDLTAAMSPGGAVAKVLGGSSVTAAPCPPPPPGTVAAAPPAAPGVTAEAPAPVVVVPAAATKALLTGKWAGLVDGIPAKLSMKKQKAGISAKLTYGKSMLMPTITVEPDGLVVMAVEDIQSAQTIEAKFEGRFSSDKLELLTGTYDITLTTLGGAMSNHMKGKWTVGRNGAAPSVAKVATAAAQAYPPDAEVHVLGVYEGVYDGGADKSSQPGTIQVGVGRTGKPIVLVLSAYRQTHWNVAVAAGVKLVGVIASGYKQQTVTGVCPGIPIVATSFAAGDSNYLQGWSGAAAVTPALAKLGLTKVTSFQGEHDGRAYDIK